jgi:hypothetical protein
VEKEAQDPYASLTPQNQRDIPRFPSTLERTQGGRATDGASIAAFIKCIHPELLEKNDDSIDTLNEKNDVLKTIVSQLSSYSRSTALQLATKVQQLFNEEKRTWGSLPSQLKENYVKDLEKIAKLGNIDLDRCMNSWGAKLLLAAKYHNCIKERSDFQVYVACT